MYTFNIFLLFSAVLFMGILLLYGWKIARGYGFCHEAILGLIFYFSIYKVVFYYGLPLILGVFSEFQYLRYINYSLSEYSILFWIEGFSWFGWLIGFLLIAKLTKGKAVARGIRGLSGNRRSGLWLLLSVAIMYIPYGLIFQEGLFGVERSFPLVLEPFKGILNYAGGASGIILFAFGVREKKFSHIVIGLAGFLTLLSVLTTRGTLVYSCVLLFGVSLYLSRRRKRLLVLSGSGLLLIASTFFIFGGMPQFRFIDTGGGWKKLELRINKEKSGGRDPLEEIEFRFGASSRMSISFLRMRETGYAAGWNPIIHSLQGYLPRVLNPDKPHPSTLFGDNIRSQASYLIYREARNNPYTMVEFSSGGHAYWELGILGVFFLPFVSGVYIGLCALYFQKLGIASLVFMFAVFKPFGYVDPKIWVSEIVVQVYQLIIPLVVLFAIIQFFERFITVPKPMKSVQSTLNNSSNASGRLVR